MTAATPDSATSPPARERPRLARLRVDRAAIVENWRFFKKQAPTAAVAAVVKADCYGLGAVGASRALAQAGARVFFTATFGEAVVVRKALGEGPQIFVLNGPTADDAEHFAAAKLTPILNSLTQIKLWAARGPAGLHGPARECGRKAPFVHAFVRSDTSVTHL